MKTALIFLAAFLAMPAEASVFDSGASFQTAAAQKLGMMSEFSVRAEKGAPTKDLDLCEDMNCPDKMPCTVVDGAPACRCTDTSCGNGARCVDGQCVNCAEGEQCNCPNGQKADGKGACDTPNYCDPNPCRGTTPQCKQSALMPNGYACGCTNTSCTPGNRCSVPCDALRQVCVTNPSDARVLIYNCTFCEEGATDCNCPSGQVADGKGGCHANCTVGQTDCPMCLDGEVWDGTECRMPCKGVKCPDGYECQNGVGTACCVVKCEKGQTDCPMCAANQIYDGTRCRYPCEGVTCPLGQQCENGKGKACCVNSVIGVPNNPCGANLDYVNGSCCPKGQTPNPGCGNGGFCNCYKISATSRL